MSTTAARDLRFAVAMNGGVSLAVWIGGVAHELDRFARKAKPWDRILGDLDVRIDVLAGTSAGGINAAFLAIAQRYGADLACLRQLWMDKAGMEPPHGADPAERHLLRAPDKGVQSLLDGEHFHQQLAEAFTALLEQDPDPTAPARDPFRMDLRLTTTAFRGKDDDLTDDLAVSVGERGHRASFHFVDEPSDVQGSPSDLTWSTPADRQVLAAELARASRSTASFPFAFEPSRCLEGETAHLEPAEVRHDHLLDGGILNNLPVDQAIDAIFAMPASHPVSRWLVTVVPDPTVAGGRVAGAASGPGADADPGGPAGAAVGAAGAAPTVKEIVAASLVGIPRNQTVGSFVAEVQQRNDRVEARRGARLALLDNGFDRLSAAADVLWPSYALNRSAPEGSGWTGYIGWDRPVIQRQVALLLHLHGLSGSTDPAVRDDIHALRRQGEVDPPPPGLATRAGQLLVRIAWPWRGDTRPAALAGLPVAPEPDVAVAPDSDAAVSAAVAATVDAAAGADASEPAPSSAAAGGVPAEAVPHAVAVLTALEVVQSAFEPADPGTEQKVRLGLLTPQRKALLDPCERDSAGLKLAGDELGHFGAFLKRSWRANDWMWGRLDASSFLFALLAKHHEMLDDQPGRAVSEARQREVQAAIVREEAPLVCEAVLADAAAGAQSCHGRKLVPLTVGWDGDGTGAGTGATDAAAVNRARWARMRAALLATVPPAAATAPAAAEEAPVLVTAAVGPATGAAGDDGAAHVAGDRGAAVAAATGRPSTGAAGAAGHAGPVGGHDGVGFPNLVSAQVTGPDPDDVTDDDVAAAVVFLQRCHIGEEHITDELGTSLVARVGLRAAATTLTVARGAGLPLKSILDKLLGPVRGVSLIANRYAQALRPRPADRHDLAWVARIATEVLAALAFLDVLGVSFGVLRPLIWGGFSAMLLTLLAFAPLTTALTIGGVGLVGLAMAWPDGWLPDDAPRWLVDLLPLKGWIGIPVILAALLIVSFPKVDRADRFLRRLVSR